MPILNQNLPIDLSCHWTHVHCPYVEGEEQIKSHITNYYKTLFGSSEAGRLSLNESLVEDIPQVTDTESDASG
jgi:hypothetical protein